MTTIVTSDLHLTDNPMDEYRWDLFPWLARMAKKHGAQQINILGDVTDAKDRHSSALVNRVVGSFEKLTAVAPVIVLKGNHDYIDEGEPFFQFMNAVGQGHMVSFVTEPMIQAHELYLPHTRDHEVAWAGIDFSKFKLIYTHQTYDGCSTENGTRMRGILPSVFGKGKAPIYSGDIHVPQNIGKRIKYVGSPYRIRFGDSFTPRVLLIRDDGSTRNLHFPCTNKHLVELDGNSSDIVASFAKALRDMGVFEDDQLKLRVRVPRERYPEWPQMRRVLRKEAALWGLVLRGPELAKANGRPAMPGNGEKGLEAGSEGRSGGQSPQAILASYSARHEVRGRLAKAGGRFLGEAMQ